MSGTLSSCYKVSMQACTEEMAAHGAEALEALPQILASRSFAKSPRLCSMLEFIVHHSVHGRTVELTEQPIGVQVFGRKPGYNSAEDTIVRGTARHLRQRLEQYYAAEGAADQIRIDIPRGSYVAVFREVSKPAESHDSPAHEESVTAPRWSANTWVLVSIIVALIAALLGESVALYRVNAKAALSKAATSASRGPQLLWHALFTPDRKTLVVPGDAGLDAFVVWEQRNVSLQDYTVQQYHEQSTVSVPPTHKDVPLSIRSVTPMADLMLVSELTRATETMGNPQAPNAMEVRYARNVAVADTHDNNLVLIGSETFNPWVTLYESQMDFVAHFDYAQDVYRIVNRAPKSGEQPLYEYLRKGPTEQKALTHIALLNNGQGTGRVLIVEGTTMGTTYGAVNFLTHESLWGPVLKQATDAHGNLRDFEVLLSGDFFHGGMGNTHIVALHVH